MMTTILAALALQAATQPSVTIAPAPDGKDEVVVTARDKRERDKEIRQFVRGFAQLEGIDPLARFSDSAICPGVYGPPDAQRRAIAQRMRRVAGAAGLKVDKADCRPNVLVILTPDRKRTLAWLQRNRPNMFLSGRREPVDVRDDGKVSIAWQVMGLVDLWGMPIPVGIPDTSLLSGATWVSGDGASRINAIVRPAVYFAAVIIDAAAIDGLTVTQLADHALMRTMAGADPGRLKASSTPSVARLLDTPVGGEAPVTLTAWDFSYLKALYAVPANHFGQRQLTTIKRHMIRDQTAAANPR